MVIRSVELSQCNKFSSSGVPTNRNEMIATRFGLPVAVVESVLKEPASVLLERNQYCPPSNTEEPTLDYVRYPLHTPKTTNHQDVMERYLDYIEVVDPFEVVPAEPEGHIRSHPTFRRYVEWYKKGLMPPYPSVFEQVCDGVRKLIGGDRRRILAAREANVHSIVVWLGRWNMETGLPLKYGDIVMAARSM